MSRIQRENIKTALAILQNEIDGDVSAALSKLTPDYTMTWMYKRGDDLFPSTSGAIATELEGVYHIKGRRYDVRSIGAGDEVVYLELVESYPRTGSGRYQTPIVLVLEFQDGKIRTGRHYCDPDISFLKLSPKDIDRAFRGRKTWHLLH